MKMKRFSLITCFICFILSSTACGTLLSSSPTKPPETTQIVASTPLATDPDPSSTRAVVTSTSIDPDQVTDVIGDIVPGRLKSVDFGYEDNPEWIYVRWDLEGGGTNQMIAEQAKEETTEILDTLYHSGIEYDQISLSGWYTITVDINNSLEYTEMFEVLYQKGKLDQIQWETVKPTYIWLVADTSSIHRLLQEE